MLLNQSNLSHTTISKERVDQIQTDIHVYEYNYLFFINFILRYRWYKISRIFIEYWGTSYIHICIIDIRLWLCEFGYDRYFFYWSQQGLWHRYWLFGFRCIPFSYWNSLVGRTIRKYLYHTYPSAIPRSKCASRLLAFVRWYISWMDGGISVQFYFHEFKLNTLTLGYRIEFGKQLSQKKKNLANNWDFSFCLMTVRA